MQKEFDGKVALITGGGTGLGRETAIAFAREGAMVVITGRRPAPLEEVVAAIQAGGGRSTLVVADVRVAADAERMVAAAVTRFGRLDILVNNAAASVFKPLCEYDEDDFESVIDTNLRGTWLGMKYAIPEIIKAGGGAVVNISSKDGLVGQANMSLYSASKAGILGLTRAAACDYGRQGVRVNAVCPAAHETPMLAQYRSTLTSDQWSARLDKYLLGRIGRPEEVASGVLFLCSERASNITGVALPIDGGFTAQ